jgi:hypothetical protein
MLFFQTEGLLQGIQIFGIEDGGQCGAVDSTFGGHGILAHISGVGYLLGKYNNVQTHRNDIIKIKCISLQTKAMSPSLLPKAVQRYTFFSA